MTIVITGAAGNIGRRLMAALPDTVGIDRAPDADISIDLMDADFGGHALQSLLGKARAVIHLATSADPDAPATVHLAAVETTARLVNACAQARVPRLVLPSSDWAEPNDPALAINAYGHSKRAIEAMAEIYNAIPGCSAIALRYGWVPADPRDAETAPDWLRRNHWPDAKLVAVVTAALGPAAHR